MILNRNEKEALWDLFQGGQANGEEMIDAVIGEVIRKLAAGVRGVEPVATQFQTPTGVWCDFINDKHRDNTIADGTWPIRSLYTATALAAARVQMNEECAKFFDENDTAMFWGSSAAKRVRALLGKEAK